MGLTSLLEKQIIRIDDHHRGSREVKNWDDISKDVHIDKRTKYKIEGKTKNVTIRIPINSEREISVEIAGEKDVPFPKKLYREIQNALTNNAQKARAFAKDVVDEVFNYKSILSDEKKAQEALDKLSKHFDLKWTGDKIATYVNGDLEVYTQLYIDMQKNKKYYFSLNYHFLELSDITGWSRHEVWLSRFR